MDALEPAEVDGRRLAVVLLDPRGDDETGFVVQGTAVVDDGRLLFELGPGMRLAVPASAAEELEEVSDEDRDLLGDAELWLSLPVGPGPDRVAPGALRDAGISWPPPGADEGD